MKHCLVVLGMHRSGTSAFTGILNQLGVDLGGQLLETQADNEKGFFENKFVVQINDAILEALKSSWDDVLPLPDDWQRYFDDSRTAQDIENFLRQDLPADKLSALKDPRLCRLLPYWLPRFAAADVKPHFAIVVRNPMEIAESLHARNGFSKEKSLLLWMQYMLDAEFYTRHLKRGFIDFDSLLQTPQAAITSLFNALDLPAPTGNADNIDFLDNDLRHHRLDASALREAGFGLAAKFHDCLASVATSTVASDEDIATIDVLRDAFFTDQKLFLNDDVAALRNHRSPLSSSDAYTSALKSLRQEFEADRVHREYRYISNTVHLNKEVASLLAQRDNLTQDRDGIRNDRDALAQEREALREARDSLLQERDELRTVRDSLIADRDEVRTDRDAVRVDRDSLVEQCQALHRQIETLEAQRQATIQERDALLTERDALLVERQQFQDSAVGKVYGTLQRAAERLGSSAAEKTADNLTADLDTGSEPELQPSQDALQPGSEEPNETVDESQANVTEPENEVAQPAVEATETVYAEGAGQEQEHALWEPVVFHKAASPLVSIIIPVFNNWEFTYACLRSVAEHTPTPHEIIVVDNHSTDATPELLQSMQGITVITNDTNEVFVNACNQAADQAQGEHLMLLNNDTEVTPGWLEAMLEPMAEQRTGIVGAKLVYPDGRLQEAGGIIWQDGTGCNYGHGDDPELPQYNYRKTVDYCSGACLLVRRSLWDEVGGFDTRYAPAYYEDTDLCFSARALNLDVVYQPRARIVHFGGASAGKETSSGYKRFQDINQHKFVEKWAKVLEHDHVLSSAGTHGARQRDGEQHILVIDHYVPMFDRDSGSQRMISLLEILMDMGFCVSFWPHDLTYDAKYTRILQDLGIETFFGDLQFEDYMAAHGADLDIVLMSRPSTARHYLELVKKYTTARTIFDTVDLHFVREQRRLELEVQQWKDLEFYLASNTDHTFVVSPTEKELLAGESFADKIAVVSNIHSLEPCRKGFEERSGLLFIGGFAHPPNEEGVLWFIDYVLPQIRNKLPDIHLTIVGSNPTDDVLAKASDTITIAGFVEDVTDSFNDARVFVSPLLHGAGVKGKIGQSFSYGLPVVTTSIGAEGMHLEDGHNALIADTETAFADQIVSLYTERTLWQKLSINGRKVITEQFSPATIRNALEEVFSLPVPDTAEANLERAQRPVLVHCHLFKNAGSTLDWSLARHFGDAFIDHREDDKMRQGSEYLGPYLANNAALYALSSHHIQFPLPEAEDLALLPIVLLRHPVDRAQSVYAFERRQDAFTPGAMKAKELDFADYIRWRLEHDVAPTVRNFHCSSLTSSGKAIIERPQYESALAQLIDCPLVGLVERYDESMVLFERTLKGYFPGIDLAYVPQNTNEGREASLAKRVQRVEDELGKSLYEDFIAANAWDLKLYEDANAILTERLGGIAHREQLLENFLARCRVLR